MTGYSEQAQLNSFLDYYLNSSSFLHISADGKMRNYDEYKLVCTQYYTSLAHQEIATISEKINVIDKNIAVTGWTGNITAQFKNGDTMIMKNYSVSNVFNKIDGNWKIIQSHESSLPPEIIGKA